MKKYIDKNKSFNTGGNEYADKVFCMMENSGVLSDAFRTRVNNLCLWIVSNHERYVDEIYNSIRDLHAEMKWLCIFSDKFTEQLCFTLEQAISHQLYLASKKTK